MKINCLDCISGQCLCFKIFFNRLPFLVAYMSAELFVSSLAFASAPLLMSVRTIFSKPKNEMSDHQLWYYFLC